MEDIRRDLKSEMELERKSMCASHRQEVGTLGRRLGEKDAQLTETVAELSRARACLEERGRGLGRVEGDLEKLREENRALGEKERAAVMEIQQLKVS